MPREGLMKLVQSQMLLKKKLDARIGELTTSNSTLCRNIEVRSEREEIRFLIRFSFKKEIENELDQEKDLSKELRLELEQVKIRETKIQQELNVKRRSIWFLASHDEDVRLDDQRIFGMFPIAE